MAATCPNLQENLSVLSDEQIDLATSMVAIGQSHIFDDWGPPGTHDEKKIALCEQIKSLDSKYPGGLKSYHAKAIKLLEGARKGANPFDNYEPKVPEGQRVEFGSEAWRKAEAEGLQQIARTGFVLVAGGLGERLGYTGIKIELPSEITTDRCYLAMYVDTILGFQERARAQTGEDIVIPLFIMTSPNTHDLTIKLIKKNNGFGMQEGQITCVQQDMVAALKDGSAAFAMDKGLIATKPHGHGDVHLVLFQSGICKQWVKKGVKYLIFFQDTNGLVIHAVPALVGVTSMMGFAMNSLTVPRRPGEACGAICNLVPKTAHEKPLCINVEYNVLGPMLKAATGKGDIADDSGYVEMHIATATVPAVISKNRYYDTLERSNGIVPEFVNPKFVGDGSGRFKKPTRLECMMQEYSRLLRGQKVGCTEIARWSCFSAVKNNLSDATKKFASNGIPESGSSGEADHYYWYRQVLRHFGADVQEAPELFEPTPGIKVKSGARIVFSPEMGVTVAEVSTHFPTPSKVKVTPRSTLILQGNIFVESLELDGCLVVKAVPGSKVTLRGLKVRNAGWQFVKVEASDPQSLQIRGYKLSKTAQRVVEATKNTVVSK